MDILLAADPSLVIMKRRRPCLVLLAISLLTLECVRACGTAASFRATTNKVTRDAIAQGLTTEVTPRVTQRTPDANSRRASTSTNTTLAATTSGPVAVTTKPPTLSIFPLRTTIASPIARTTGGPASTFQTPRPTTRQPLPAATTRQPPGSRVFLPRLPPTTTQPPAANSPAPGERPSFIPRLPITTTTTPRPQPSTSTAGPLPPDPTGSRLPRECGDIQLTGEGRVNGRYQAYRPSCLNPLSCQITLTCDLLTDGGGWTVVQQRLDGDTDFFRDWKAYKDGFGSERNFWIGNEYLYEVTNMDAFQLLIQLTDFDGRSSFALYDNFVVAPEENNYNLTVGAVFGTDSADNLGLSRGAAFGTFDQGVVTNANVTCGSVWQSGWWHSSNCLPSGNLNVPYEPSLVRSSHLQGIIWFTDSGPKRLMSVQMKVRRSSFTASLADTSAALRASLAG